MTSTPTSPIYRYTNPKPPNRATPSTSSSPPQKTPDARIRFWTAFALGGKVRKDPRAIRALESLLTDNEAPTHGWWSVGKEALAMLRDKQQLNAEVAKVLENPEASEGDRRWAESYMS